MALKFTNDLTYLFFDIKPIEFKKIEHLKSVMRALKMYFYYLFFLIGGISGHIYTRLSVASNLTIFNIQNLSDFCHNLVLKDKKL